MASIVNLLSRAYNTPLYITPDKLDVILGVLERKLDGGAIKSKYSVAEKPTMRQTPGCMAVIDVFGTLVHRASGMDAMSGMTSYESLTHQFDEYMQNDGIASIVFRLDTPGGEGAGLFELTKRIRAARGQGKRIIAYVDEAAFSAGYAIASACDTIVMPETAAVGSIGVIAKHVDRSKMEEKLGVKVTAIYAGAHKNDLSPHEPLTDAGAAILQEMVDRGYETFCQSVADGREMNVADVKATEAGIYWGANAVKVGLADEIQNWDWLMVAGLEINSPVKGRKGGTV